MRNPRTQLLVCSYPNYGTVIVKEQLFEDY
jgi:hypothetical protein